MMKFQFLSLLVVWSLSETSKGLEVEETLHVIEGFDPDEYGYMRQHSDCQFDLGPPDPNYQYTPLPDLSSTLTPDEVDNLMFDRGHDISAKDLDLLETVTDFEP